MKLSHLKTAAAVVISLFVLAAGYVLFHPGVGFIETALAQTPATGMPQAGDFTVDPMHTCVGFDIGHLGISRVQGRFSKVSGSLHADAKDIGKSSVSITMDATSVDTAVAPRDADLRSDHFFDVAKFPTLTFASTAIKKNGKKGYIAVGNLTIKGVTKPVTINFKVFGPIKDMRGMTRIGVVADPLVIHRSDYGMTFDAPPMISDDVNVRLSLEAIMAQGS